MRRKVMLALLVTVLMPALSVGAYAAEECVEHDYQWVEQAPTCNEQGYRAYVCRDCGQVDKSEPIPALGHDGAAVTPLAEATCSSGGQEQYTCGRCGYTEIKQTDPLEHTYTVWVKEATCKQDGYTRHTCTVCGSSYNTDQVKAAGHQYEAQVVAPTCTANGYTRYECAKCGDSYRENQVEKTGHHYDSGVLTKEPTQTAMGRITYSCVDCDDTYTETTPKLSNPFEDLDKKAYYFDAVLWAVDRGITNGTDATHFTPDAVCTRGQVVTFLWRQAGECAPKCTDCPFVDVKSGSYYYDAVLWAVEQGITNGVDATHFDPDCPCTRSQVVTFIHRAKGTPDPKSTAHFSDVNAGSFYAKAVSWAYEEGITTGTSATTFSPNNSCTRAQIVTFLHRARNK